MKKSNKPDRFERDSWKAFHKWTNGPQVDGWMTIPVSLLRREHRWMVRMVKDALPTAQELGLSKFGIQELLLKQLAQRRK